MSACVGSSKNLKDLKEPLQLMVPSGPKGTITISHVPCGCGSSAPRLIQRSFSGSKCGVGLYSVKDRGEAGFWSGRELSAALHQSDSDALILCAVMCVVLPVLRCSIFQCFAAAAFAQGCQWLTSVPFPSCACARDFHPS